MCDPPRENREKGDDTGTRAMTRHAKRVTIARICAYLISKTKANTVPFVCRANAFVLRSVLEDTLNVRHDTRAKRHPCYLALVPCNKTLERVLLPKLICLLLLI